MENNDRFVVLLVAADYQTLQLLEQACTRADFRVVTATDLDQVISAIKLQMPDLVVCDTDVKGVNRQSLQQHTCNHQRLEVLPFIFLESAGSAQEVRRYLDLDQYLSKPFDPMALVTLAKATLDLRQSLVQFEEHPQNHPTIAHPKILRREIARELRRIDRYGSHMSICVFDIVEQQTETSIPARSVDPLAFDRIADCLTAVVRTVDSLARLSRRRFLWIMPETDTRQAHLAVQRLMSAFAEIPSPKAPSPFTMRVGLATAPDDGLSYDELLELAQQELTQRPIETAQQTPQRIAGK